MARRKNREKKIKLFPPAAEVRPEQEETAPEAEENSLLSRGEVAAEVPAETFGPEPGELFFEEEPKPFALSVREILDEYRSDSSPARYAMAVELGEADDWEEYLGPPAETEAEPIYPEDGRAVQDILHATWQASHPAEQEAPVYPRVDGYHLGIDSSPYEEPQSTAASGGYTAIEKRPSWADIVSEYQTDPEPYDAGEEKTARRRKDPPKKVRLPMPHMKGKPDTPVSPADAPEPGLSAPLPEGSDELPAGIRPLTERRAQTQPAQSASHLSVEDILAEFHGFAPAGRTGESAEAAPVVPPPAEEIPEEEASRRRGRLAGMEEEARSLFAAIGRREERAAPRTEATEEEKRDDPFTISLPEEEAPLPEGSDAAAAPDEEETGAERRSPLAGLKDRLRAPERTEKREKKKKAKAAPVSDVPPPEPPRREALDGLDDGEISPAAYAVDDEYESEEPDANAFPSFGEYLAGLASGLLIRLRGIKSAGSTAETMETDEEDLGPEVRPAAASRYYGTFVQSLRLRFRIALILWLVLAYISLGLPAAGMLRTLEVAAGMCLGLQLGIMLLSLDVVSGSAINLVRGRFGADALAVLSCILTSFDALAVMLGGFGSPHIPLCLLSSFSLLGVLFSSLLSARGLRKSLRVPAIGKRAFSVTAETELTDKTITLVKSGRPVSGFVRRSEEAAPDETAYNRAAPLLLILSLIMSLVLVLVKKSTGDFLFVLTAVLAPAVPFTALLCYALPFFVGSERIFSSGAAIAGWSGLCDIGSSHNLIVTDRDLFPDDSVEIDTIRIFADMPSEKIISYAGTMISASGSGVAPCFAELMERNGCAMRQVEDFEFLPGGGVKGSIDGQTILCGGTELMRLMNVRIPYRLVGKTSVLLAIDGVLYGIFNMKYEPNPTVRRALVGLIRSNRHPIFAIRDFNVNPEMLHETFDVATDGYDFPPYVERFAISEAKPSEDRKIAAVLCREGLGPLVHMADTGRSMYIIIRINLMISLLASVFGVFAVFFQLLTAGTISMAALFLYAIVWLIPVTIISLIVKI